MYRTIDLLKYEVYVQTDRPLCKPIYLLTYEVYVQTDRPLKI